MDRYHSPSLVIMPPKLQPTKGGAQRRIERTETPHHLRDENIGYEEKVKGDDKYFQEGLSAIARGHLKRSIAKE
ncbi:hypothetical protein HAX54_038674 [Datura stramonium]|uniref:Uncharacterized protein n=1 Tax=Datura stramonium TaxID=4076 RepID=A0ABS8VN61_DATST|nr:hypothetical protein [Datura stramonium]